MCVLDKTREEREIFAPGINCEKERIYWKNGHQYRKTDEGYGCLYHFCHAFTCGSLKVQKHICMAGVQSMCNVKENIQLIVYYVEE